MGDGVRPVVGTGSFCGCSWAEPSLPRPKSVFWRTPRRKASWNGAFLAICSYCGPFPWVWEAEGAGLTGGIWEGRKNRRAPTGPPCGARAQAAGAWLGKAHKRKQREGNGSLRSTTPVLVPGLPHLGHTLGRSLPTPGLCAPLPVKLQVGPHDLGDPFSSLRAISSRVDSGLEGSSLTLFSSSSLMPTAA